MIEESFLKSNFLGRDGFRWWIGQIPPLSTMGNQVGGSGWGNRYKVRIMGYHPYNTVELPDEDLPWAQCLIPTTSGSGAANVATDVKLQQGDVVFGFFLDGDNAQVPVILATFGRTSQVPSSEYVGPFIPFTGYTDKIKNDGSSVKRNETNEQNAASQKSPRNVSPRQAASIGNNEISYYSAIGDTVQLATASSQTVSKISTEVGNLINTIQNAQSIIGNSAAYVTSLISREVDRVTKKIQNITSGLVNGMVNNLYKTMAPLLNQGLKLLYKLVYDLVLLATGNPIIAHQAGVAAQTAMVSPIKTLQDAIPCVANNIINGLGNTIKSILNSVVNNVTNFVTCAANQFTGALVNDIIGRVSSGLSSAIGGVANILQFFGDFSVGNTLRSTTDGLSGIVTPLNCNQNTEVDSGVSQWVIGSGPKNVPPVPFSDILNNANVANSLALASGASDVLAGFDIFNSSTSIPNQISPTGGCYTGYPTVCNPPIINIFGGGGSGASAVPLFGSLVGSGKNRTGSIIGIDLLNGGSGYEFPPFVEITDNCGQGYGAIARSIINDAGQVISIYIISEGENYPVGTVQPYIVSEVTILNPGQGYEPTDVVVDNFGNTYKIQTLDGAIIKVSPINIADLNDLPILTVKTNTGSGALLKPVISTRPETFQGEIKQVIDCPN